VRGDGEEVLGEAVVDLAGDARALLRDRASELREANGAPDAHEQDAEAQDAKEVPLRDGSAVDERREDVVQRCEEHQRRAEREPAIEVVAVIAEPPGEADDREEVQECLRGEQPGQHERDARVLARRSGRDVRQGRSEHLRAHPGRSHQEAEGDERVPERPFARADPATDERCGRDQRPAHEPGDEAGPRLRAPERMP
jgi:hypothetical protein